jgi:hypothetical protein
MHASFERQDDISQLTDFLLKEMVMLILTLYAEAETTDHVHCLIPVNEQAKNYYLEASALYGIMQ